MLLPEEIAVAITAAAISISKQLSDEDAALFGAAFTQLGDTLATIAAARSRLEATAKAQSDEQNERMENTDI